MCEEYPVLYGCIFPLSSYLISGMLVIILLRIFWPAKYHQFIKESGTEGKAGILILIALLGIFFTSLSPCY